MATTQWGQAKAGGVGLSEAPLNKEEIEFVKAMKVMKMDNDRIKERVIQAREKRENPDAILRATEAFKGGIAKTGEKLGNVWESAKKEDWENMDTLTALGKGSGYLFKGAVQGGWGTVNAIGSGAMAAAEPIIEPVVKTGIDMAKMGAGALQTITSPAQGLVRDLIGEENIQGMNEAIDSGLQNTKEWWDSQDQTTKDMFTTAGEGILNVIGLGGGGKVAGAVGKQALKAPAKYGVKEAASVMSGKVMNSVLANMTKLGQKTAGIGSKIAEKMPAVGKAIGKFGNKLDEILPKAKNLSEKQIIVQNKINKNVEDLLKQNKGIQSKVSLLKQKNTDVNKILSEPDVFKGLRIEDGTINPEDSILTLDDRIDKLMDVKSQLLPEIDKYIPKIPKEEIRINALSSIKNQFTPIDEKKIIEKINNQLNSLPDNLSLEEADKFRAIFRKSARDAKDLQKEGSEYAALENSTRSVIFDRMENLPFDKSKDYAKFNTYIKNLIDTKEFLDKTIRGQKVKGGRLGKYFARTIGAVAGSPGGFFGTIVGSELGGAISNIILNNQLGNSFKMKLIKKMTNNDQVIMKSEELLNMSKNYQVPLLEAPKTEFKSIIPSRETINLPSKTESTIEKEEISKFSN